MIRRMAPVPQNCAARPFTHSTKPVVPSRTHLHCAAVSQTNSEGSRGKQRVVFLGTPDVAAGVLQELLTASQQPDSQFEVCCVVSQPGKPRGRGNRGQALPSPVEALARDSGLVPAEGILCPASAREAPFLEHLAALQPDLAVTAAYGNLLPQRFLDIPRLGTLNVHPSLLPRYRGAAPVQRALEDGVSETGVSVAFTVLQCDAGPVLAQQKVAVGPDVQAPELLSHLFSIGGRLLVDRLPDVWAGRAGSLAKPQDESQVLHAAKLSREESVLDFRTAPAQVLHNRVRAFAGWPGTAAVFWLLDEASGSREPTEIKIVRTRAPSMDSGLGARGSSATLNPAPTGPATPLEVSFSKDALLIPCAEGTVLEVLQVQPPTKKAMPVKDFKNGLRGKRLLLAPLPAPAAA